MARGKWKARRSAKKAGRRGARKAKKSEKRAYKKEKKAARREVRKERIASKERVKMAMIDQGMDPNGWKGRIGESVTGLVSGFLGGGRQQLQQQFEQLPESIQDRIPYNFDQSGNYVPATVPDNATYRDSIAQGGSDSLDGVGNTPVQLTILDQIMIFLGLMDDPNAVK